MKKFFLAILLPLFALMTGCTQIDTGNVGVESTMGQYKDVEMPAGVYMSIFKTVNEISVKENAISLENMTPKSKNNLTMADFDVDVYYRVDPSKAADLMIKYSGDVARPAQGDGLLVGYNVMVRQAREASYKAAASFDAAEMNGKRTEIAAMTQDTLQAALDKETGKGWFIVTNVIVRNVTPDKSLETSIQNAAKMDFEIDQKRKQKTLAEEEAKRLKAEAQGVAEANTIISNSLTPQLLRMREIEAQAKFANQGTHTVLMGGAGNALINVK